MTKVTVTTIGNQTFLNLFNSCEIFSVKGFDTERKAYKREGLNCHRCKTKIK
jgi:formamidopyrimidine-DNA glycosylase